MQPITLNADKMSRLDVQIGCADWMCRLDVHISCADFAAHVCRKKTDIKTHIKSANDCLQKLRLFARCEVLSGQ
jgi:hypothetical protein